MVHTLGGVRTYLVQASQLPGTSASGRATRLQATIADVMAMLAGSRGAPSSIGRMARRSAAYAVIAGDFGTLATGFGAGLGIRHLQKTGVAVESVLGLVVLVAGLALLGFAIVTAWRGLRSWWRLVLLPAAMLCLAVAMSLALAVMFTFVPRTELVNDAR